MTKEITHDALDDSARILHQEWISCQKYTKLTNRQPWANLVGQSRVSRPDPKRVDTWQPPRALEWDPVSQAPSKNSQGILISIL